MEYLTWNRKRLITEIKRVSFFMTMQLFNSEIKASEHWKSYTDEDDAKLNKMTDSQLRNIYLNVKKHDAEFKKQHQEHQERNLFYNQESANADYQYWGKHASWSIEEGITLLLGKDPRKVKWEAVKQHVDHSPFAKKFEEIYNLAARYASCGQLPTAPMPGVFLAWSKRMGYEAAPQLVQQVEILGNQILDWPTLYEKATEIIAQHNQKIAELEKLIHEQENQLEEKELKETERQSLYKLISIMACDGYGYKPKECKSSIPNEIANAATEIIGENIDADTVRKWLRKAIARYPFIKT
jgi:hypothetical protein